MILEVALIAVQPAKADDFAAAYERGAVHLRAAKGCRSVAMRRCIERPDRFMLTVEWDTLEDHTVGFRNSEGFQKWRGEVGSFFAEPPLVEHYRLV